MFILAQQLSEGLITVDDLDELDEKFRAASIFGLDYPIISKATAEEQKVQLITD